MRTMTRAIPALALLLFTQAASAQMATPIRYNEGPGVKLTDGLVFHPGIAIEGRYDSNVLFTDSQLQGAPYMRLIAHMNLATLSRQRLEGGKSYQPVTFQLQTALGYREYFSGEDNVVQQRALDVEAGLNFAFAPSRHFSFSINDSYTRQVSARNFLVTGGGTVPSQTLSLNQNRLEAAANIIPGGGRLSFKVGYAFNLHLFEDEGFDEGNKLFHQIIFNGKWKLLPMTAITLDVTQDFTGYIADATSNVGSKPFRAYAGFMGLLTSKL
ncbi:MAG: hypothetical protein JRH20_28130, partial [Deltaproteobacteria bacterium]|nr:hypothetical protein [Deltaproteobacteria bacterium]